MMIVKDNKKKKVIFVYNANSGLVSVVKDFWKKILRPSSYQCNLCLQTFSAFGVKKDWKNFIQNLEIETEFLHKNEFEERYDFKNTKYPSAYLYDKDNLTLFITQDEMNEVKSLEEMEALVSKKVNLLT
ncbi:MAG: hypothetical protein ACFE75_09315 [Candidatus Hodarchaeota archaeon]